MTLVSSFRSSLVPVLAAGWLAACGGGGTTTAPVAPAPPAPVAPEPPAPAPPPEPLGVPANLRVSSTGPDFIEWTWAPVDRAAAYQVQVAATESGLPAAAPATVRETRHQVAVEPGTTWYLRVRASAGTAAPPQLGDWSPGVSGMSEVLASCRWRTPRWASQGRGPSREDRFDFDRLHSPDAGPMPQYWRRPRAAAAAQRPGSPTEVTANAAGQILVELRPEDTEPANLFDLSGRTLVFTPDGRGGYSREVRPLAWEDDIGPSVANNAEVRFDGFQFPFAGQEWDSFHLSGNGRVTFGELSGYDYHDFRNRFDTMEEIVGKFADVPTIAPLFKPISGDWKSTQHVASTPERILITWITSDSHHYFIHGVYPAEPSCFQAVLGADGSIRFNYWDDLPFGDGIVGLFSSDAVRKGRRITTIEDGRDSVSPHLDLVEVGIYETDSDSVILEFVTRDPIPVPAGGDLYCYTLYFDTDEPWWQQFDPADEDFTWSVCVGSEDRGAYGPGVRKMLPTEADNRILLLADADAVRGLSAMVVALAVHFRDDSFVERDFSSAHFVEFSDRPAPVADLSRSDTGSWVTHQEVFRFRSLPDSKTISCRVIEVLGDEFDLLTFHSEFRVDSQESSTPWNSYRPVDTTGIGADNRGWIPFPCGEARLRGHWSNPVWMQSHFVSRPNQSREAEEYEFDLGLYLFAHEFMHSWTAFVDYERNSRPERLYEEGCECHWRLGLHAPAAFLWRPELGGKGSSLMGGAFWEDNGDGTFSPTRRYGSGASWLDLYLIGLAEAREVPDMFLVRDVAPVARNQWWGPHTGRKEVVSIEQVVAAEGLRTPGVAQSQKDFNAGFVYLLAPGASPTPELLELHEEYMNAVPEYWSHITGGRSRITIRN